MQKTLRRYLIKAILIDILIKAGIEQTESAVTDGIYFGNLFDHTSKMKPFKNFRARFLAHLSKIPEYLLSFDFNFLK